jgi:hypothetical protein
MIPSRSPPDVDSLTANPLLDSYGLVLLALQPQQYDLADLHIPTARFVVLLKSLQSVQAPRELARQDTIKNLIVSAERLGSRDKLSWEHLETVISKQRVTHSKYNPVNQ